MILYGAAKFHPRFLCQLTGSVLPFSVAVALPCGLLAAACSVLSAMYLNGEEWSLLSSNGAIEGAAFSGFNFLIGFLVVFRAQEAHSRFWEGCSRILAMQGEWFDAASSLCAFTRKSIAEPIAVTSFQHTLVRLFSLLHSAVLTELCAGHQRSDGVIFTSDRAFELELIDVEGLNTRTLRTFSETGAKVELVFLWIQQMIVEADHRNVFSVAPPILSRSFQELARGMVEYTQSSKIARFPLPFPYVQATELLLFMHWIVTPILMSIWTRSALWAFALTFIQVTFFWSLNSTASELENPFGTFINNLPAAELQRDFNEKLLLLVSPPARCTPRHSKVAKLALNSEKFILQRSGTFGTNGIKGPVPHVESKDRLGDQHCRKSLGEFFCSTFSQRVNNSNPFNSESPQGSEELGVQFRQPQPATQRLASKSSNGGGSLPSDSDRDDGQDPSPGSSPSHRLCSRRRGRRLHFGSPSAAEEPGDVSGDAEKGESSFDAKDFGAPDAVELCPEVRQSQADFDGGASRFSVDAQDFGALDAEELCPEVRQSQADFDGGASRFSVDAKDFGAPDAEELCPEVRQSQADFDGFFPDQRALGASEVVHGVAL